MQYVSDASGYAITSRKYLIVHHNAGLLATGSGGLYHCTGNEPLCHSIMDGHRTNGNRIDRFIRRQVLRMSNRIPWRSIRCESKFLAFYSMRIERGPVRFDIESNGYGPFETRIERGWFRSIFESNGATRSVENRSIRSNGVGQQPRHMPKNASVFDFAWLRTRNGTRKRVEANSSPVVVARSKC